MRFPFIKKKLTLAYEKDKINYCYMATNSKGNFKKTINHEQPDKVVVDFGSTAVTGIPHWESTVFINDKKAETENSLATPHQYNITDLLIPGKNRISIRIDNRVAIPVGVNSHSISDHTQ
jgi:hypothetical protein